REKKASQNGTPGTPVEPKNINIALQAQIFTPNADTSTEKNSRYPLHFRK
ncbi:hypothetical protein NPIL_401991, partial [Nephila pilipes]